MDSKSKAGDALHTFRREYGAPEKLRFDGSKEQTGKNTEFQRQIRKHNIQQHISEPNLHNQSPAEGVPNFVAIPTPTRQRCLVRRKLWKNREGDEVFPKDLAEAASRVTTYKPMMASTSSKKDHTKNNTEDEVSKIALYSQVKTTRAGTKAERKQSNVSDVVRWATTPATARRAYQQNRVQTL
jgi:hypothetical protein